MAKENRKRDEAKTGPGSEKTSVQSAPVEEKAASAPKPQPKPEPETAPEPLVSFDRWFASKAYKPHWKAGMAAYTDITARRSVSDWDRVFKGY